jgi:transposase-like protein
MNGHGSKFSRKMEGAIAALLTSPNIAAAAQTAGISPTTLRKWLAVEEFAARYKEERGKLLETTSNRLRSRAVEAVEVLATLMNDPETAAATRAICARSIISLAVGCAELDFEQRLSELEERMERTES